MAFLLHSIRGAVALGILAVSTGATTPPEAGPDTRPASAGLGGHRLQQVALTTTDLPRAVAFYRDVLGLPFLFQSNGMAFFDVAGTRLMIGMDRERPQGRPAAALYFDTPTFDATMARMEAIGIAFVGPVETVQTTRAGDLKLREFRDPDGNTLAIMGIAPHLR